jgi:hypothetical protein
MDFAVEQAAVSTVEAWIEKLFECKPLTELEVKQLCEKVGVCVCVCGWVGVYCCVYEVAVDT